MHTLFSLNTSGALWWGHGNETNMQLSACTIGCLSGFNRAVLEASIRGTTVHVVE